VQAQFGEIAHVKGALARTPPPQQQLRLAVAEQERTRYKGVQISGGGSSARWAAKLNAGREIFIGIFDDALEAARVYDDAARALGRLAVNFPRPGTAEVQANPGQRQAHFRAAVAHDKPSAQAPQPQPQPQHRISVHPRPEPAAETPQAAPSAGGRLARRCKRVRREQSISDDDDGAVYALPTEQHPLAAAPALAPPAAPPANAAPAQQDGDGDASGALALTAPDTARAATLDAATAPVAAFLRAVAPPLSQLDAVIAALPSSGASMAHLTRIAAAATPRDADRAMLLGAAADALHIHPRFDRLSFFAALLELAPRTDAAAGRASCLLA
jgi:hypothetical protein